MTQGYECGGAFVKHVFAWIVRTAILFALIVAALVAYQMLRPSFDGYGETRDRVSALDAGADELAAYASDAIDRSNAVVADNQAATKGALDVRIAAATGERAELRRDHGSDLTAVLKSGAAAVIENRKRGIRIALLTREIDTLRTLSGTLDARRPGESVRQAVDRQTSIMRRAAKINADSRAGVAAIRTGNAFDRLRDRDADARLVALANRSKAAYDAAERRAGMLIDSQRRLNAITARASRSVATVRAQFDAVIGEQRKQLSGNVFERLRGWAERVGLAEKAHIAAFILAGIILTPLFIRIIFYYVLAPIAAGRPTIRLRVPGGGKVAIEPSERSTTSIGVRLDVGEELLVRQGFLQATSSGGSKRTRGLLDYRHVFSSIAAGLTFLTRIRGDAQDVTTISAIDDPFAEVTMLVLCEGAACVLHPRALVAVAQPIDRGLRITTHWRLGSLNAWLTLQLRFLVFHGPARLVIKGGRGVRVEPAMRGRVFGQDQLVGFSADLAYSATRTETFWPYLIGREPLLKDKVIDGDGILIVEEAPLSGRDKAGIRRGLEGLFDGALKVVGI